MQYPARAKIPDALRTDAEKGSRKIAQVTEQLDSPYRLRTSLNVRLEIDNTNFNNVGHERGRRAQ